MPTDDSRALGRLRSTRDSVVVVGGIAAGAGALRLRDLPEGDEAMKRRTLELRVASDRCSFGDLYPVASSVVEECGQSFKTILGS